MSFTVFAVLYIHAVYTIYIVSPSRILCKHVMYINAKRRHNIANCDMIYIWYVYTLWHRYVYYYIDVWSIYCIRFIFLIGYILSRHIFLHLSHSCILNILDMYQHVLASWSSCFFSHLPKVSKCRDLLWPPLGSQGDATCHVFQPMGRQVEFFGAVWKKHGVVLKRGRPPGRGKFLKYCIVVDELPIFKKKLMHWWKLGLDENCR